MPNFNHHPAPGLGDLMAGFTVVPQNPVMDGSNAPKYIPRIGELVAASVSVPQNPVIDAIGSVSPMRPDGKSGGCGCASCSGVSGLGALDLGNVSCSMSSNPLVVIVLLGVSFWLYRKYA